MSQPTFGTELRRLREQHGMSLKKFAQLVHYDPGYLSKIENGLKPPTSTLAARCDAILRTNGTLSALVPEPQRHEPQPSYKVRIPVVIDGQPVLLSADPKQFGGSENGYQHRAPSTALSEKLPGSSAAMIVSAGGMTWQWELPGGRAFGGATLPTYLCEETWSTKSDAVIASRQIRPLAEFVSSVPRGIIITETGNARTPVLLDTSAARKQFANSIVTIPQAFEADDLTLGILWALANLDEALLNDDAYLSQARRHAHRSALNNTDISRETLADLSSISSMWLGSNSCARFIVHSTRNFSTQPVFWTREQRGEEAAAWLFFRHKFDYLLATSRRFSASSGSASRIFCVPESAVLDSLPSERILLLLAAALMESLGIRTQVCPDSTLSQVDGFVLSPNSEAVIANWVRTDGCWHVDRTRSLPRVREFGDAIGQASANGLCDTPSPTRRLAALSDYLGIGWKWLTSRCRALAEHSCQDFARPRSRLLSTKGVDVACRYVASQHNELASADS